VKKTSELSESPTERSVRFAPGVAAAAASSNGEEAMAASNNEEAAAASFGGKAAVASNVGEAAVASDGGEAAHGIGDRDKS
jgi:hypothetical protein